MSREGYLRTASSEHKVDRTALNNDYIHLTNNAVQKNCPNYGTFEDGNQLSFSFFDNYLQNESLKTSILPKMKHYAGLTMASARNKLNQNRRKLCFELFGFHYIIDSELNVWLIEVNTNPCIEESSKLL
jgi:hypothetical protein